MADVEEERRMDSDGTGDTLMGGGEKRGGLGDPLKPVRLPHDRLRHRPRNGQRRV